MKCISKTILINLACTQTNVQYFTHFSSVGPSNLILEPLIHNVALPWIEIFDLVYNLTGLLIMDAVKKGCQDLEPAVIRQLIGYFIIYKNALKTIDCKVIEKRKV